MNRLILCIIVALLTATTAQGAASASAESLSIMINGNPASGQEFTVGDTITITCDVVASASISEYSSMGYYRAIVDSVLELNYGSVIDSESYYTVVYGYDPLGASVSANETLSITYTLTDEGSYTIEAFSAAYAQYSTGAWLTAASDVSGPVYLTFEVVSPAVLTVGIDIKPGSSPNTINLGSNGVIPVAILSSADFDATQVDPATVTLAGAGVALRGKGTNYLTIEKDVNGDGLIDLEVKVETENLDPGTFQDGSAILTGSTFGGQAISGSDEITIVPPA